MTARAKDEGLVYLRRSTGRQETGIHEQLAWACAEAARLGVRLDVPPRHLEHMLASGQNQCGPVFLDDGISGSDLSRPAFLAFRREALTRKTVSHLFIHMSDRFARPELATEAMQSEIELARAGITIVFHNRVSPPRVRGQHNFAEDIQLLFEYTQNGEFLNKLATRVLQTQANLSRRGYRTGGAAPYGFGRVLVDARGDEVQDLAVGTTVRREGCHVVVKPKDPEKIAVWLRILQLYGDKGWGLQRIAQHLDGLGIPSPNAGRTRKVAGKTGAVSGRWSARTVARLIDDADIVGLSEYGKRSSGTHRRHGPDGPRTLGERDRTEGGEATRAVLNAKEHTISVSVRAADVREQELFEACQRQREKRGANRRGISRVPDPAKYPLALRIHDLEPGCGKPLYARKHRARAVYVCSTYMRSNGSDCHHNHVDAEAALSFVLDGLRQGVVMHGGREALRGRLLELARSESPPQLPLADDLALAKVNLRTREAELGAIGRNLARAASAAAYAAVEREYLTLDAEVIKLRQQFERLQVEVVAAPVASPEHEVESALQLFDQIEKITKDPAARGEIPQLLRALNVNLWLRFGERPKASGHKVRAVEGGILTIGDGPRPTPLGQGGDGTDPPDGGSGCGGKVPPSAEKVSAIDERHQESGGFTIGNHGKPG